MKVKISKLPKRQSGGQSQSIGGQNNFALSTGAFHQFDTHSKQDATNPDIRGAYPEVDRKDANLEVELGEIIVAPDMSTIYRANGKKHSKGGTPIKAKEGSYIVSNYVETNPEVMEAVGIEGEAKKKQTWAEMLKSKINPTYYNTLAGVLHNKENKQPVDPYMLNTAEIKLPEFQKIVSQVALGNELTKAVQGKDYSIPAIAQVAMQGMQTPEPDVDDEPMYEMRDGGYLPMAQDGRDWLKPWTKSNTFNGGVSTTGVSTTYPAEGNPIYDDYNYWKGENNGADFNQLGDYQKFIYQQSLQKNPTAVANMWKTFGQTAANSGKPMIDPGMLWNRDGSPNVEAMGASDLVNNFADGRYPGARTAFLSSHRPPRTTAQGVPIPTTLSTLPNAPTSIPVSAPKVSPSGQPVKGETAVQSDLGYNAFDVMGLADAMSTPINTRYPWAAKPDVAYMNPQFDDPNYYPIQQQARQRGELMNQISSPQTARAIASSQGDIINGLIQETARSRGNNLQIANNAQANNAQLYGNHSAQIAGINTGLYDKTVSTLDQADIARKLKREDVRSAAQNMVNNKINMDQYLMRNPQYTVDGAFWNKIKFTQGKGIDEQGSGAQQDPMTHFAAFQDKAASYGFKPGSAEMLDLYENLYGNKARTTTKYKGNSTTPSETRIVQ